jgi:hypothetical protein
MEKAIERLHQDSLMGVTLDEAVPLTSSGISAAWSAGCCIMHHLWACNPFAVSMKQIVSVLAFADVKAPVTATEEKRLTGTCNLNNSYAR